MYILAHMNVTGVLGTQYLIILVSTNGMIGKGYIIRVSTSHYPARQSSPGCLFYGR